MGNVRRPLAALLASLLVAAVGGACGSSNGGSTFHGNGDDDASTDGSSFDSSFQFGDGQPSFGDGALPGDAAGFDVEPSALQTITVAAGQTTPTVAYKATLNGNPVSAAWTVDRGDLATIGAGPSPDGTLKPTGTTGGLVNVIAGYGGKTIPRAVFIEITASQNGSNANAPGEGQQIATSGGPARRGRRRRRRRRRGARRRR